jgi:two-component system nitrate/nitrite response regulator NarL
MSEKIRVFVVDDHSLFRRGLVGLLAEQADLEVVGEAESGPQAVEGCLNCEPDVVLLDVHMPAGGGVEAVRAIKEGPGARVLMLTISERDEDLMGAIAAGADGYLLKSAEPDQLYRAIRRVAEGQGVLSPSVTLKVMNAVTSASAGWALNPLSPREREVMGYLARGATTAQIAQALGIAASTVKTHVEHILRKLEAANRAEAVAKAAARGWIGGRR